MKRKSCFILILLLFLSVVFFVTSCDEEEKLSNIVKAMPSNGEVWTQVSELQSVDTRVLEDGTVLGTLFYAAPGADFSGDPDLQTGWYLCLTVGGSGKYVVVSTRETKNIDNGDDRDLVLLVGNATVGYLDSATIVTNEDTIALDLTKLDLVARSAT